MRNENSQLFPFTGIYCFFYFTVRMLLFSRIRPGYSSISSIILNNKEDDLHFSPVIFKKHKNLLQLKQWEYLLDIKSEHKLMFPTG